MVGVWIQFRLLTLAPWFSHAMRMITSSPPSGIDQRVNVEQRLVIISNSVPLPKPDGSLPAGGLTSGLEDALKSQRTLWFGTSGKINTTSYERSISRAGIDLVTVDMTASMYKNYYEGFSNAYLWPMFHSLFDKLDLKPGYLEAYYAVNQLLVNRLINRLEDGDVIWVHDYHLIPFGNKLRASYAAKCKAMSRDCAPLKIGFFLHIPFPAYEKAIGAMTCGFDGLSCEALKTLFTELSAYDLIGVHTKVDAQNLENTLLTAGAGVVPKIEVHPIGINPVEFKARATAGQAQALKWLKQHVPKLNLSAKQLLIGVDRLDYTKGIPERLRGFELMLRQHPEMHDKVEFLQIAPPSRAGVPMYKALKDEVMATMHIMDLEWRGKHSVHFYNENVDRSIIAALCRLAQVGVVTPLQDGMNLFAKEFVAAHGDALGSPDMPGVLLLSNGAGAAYELASPAFGPDQGPGAIMVDPYDTTSIADGLYQALTMEQPERLARWKRMNLSVHAVTACSWGTNFLEALKRYGDKYSNSNEARGSPVPPKPAVLSVAEAPLNWLAKTFRNALAWLS